jgi:hypothetical protein
MGRGGGAVTGRRCRRHLLLATGPWLALLSVSAFAAPPVQDPDWPCQQRLVPQLSAGTYWTGAPIPDVVDWRSNPRVADLVQAVMPRDVSIETGTGKIEAFAKGLKGDEKTKILPVAFAGILDETNQERGQFIARLKELTRRERDIAAQVAKLTDEINAIPADANGETASRRTDAMERQAFLTRTFDETRRTMQYACEAPTQLEARLGAYARALQSNP